LNNVLTPERITPTPSKHTPAAAAAVISSAHPTSTTAAMAGQVPLEGKRGVEESSMPGNFPETPQNEADAFSVHPLPATAGIGNPVQLKAGEKVPDSSEITSNNINTAVTTDKESYEKGSAATGGQNGVGAFGVPPVSKNMIPESSLPMGGEAAKDPGYTLSSAGAQSTTADLAGKVPLEPRGTAAEVPEVVKESQAEAHVPPEASGSPEAVEEKSEMEQQLQSQVPPEPATSESGPSTGKVAGIAAGGAAAVGGAAAATFFSAKATASRAVGGTPSGTEAPAAPEVPEEHTAAGVPPMVEESLEKAHTGPEAAANEEAVVEKQAMESELLKHVKTDQSTGEHAPVATAPTTSTAPKATTESTPGAAAATSAAPEKAAIDSRDISPMSKTPGQTQPIVTTGVGSTSTPATSTASPSKASTDSPASPSVDKKKNRLSFFDKLKTRISHKDKK
jgi:hypothetical protein